MPVERVVVLVNGRAGSVGGEPQAMVDRLADAFAATGVEAEIQVIEPDELATTIGSVWAVKRPDAIIVAGGDGTINSAANAIAGTDVVLGVLPLGTFNHFAQDLGLPNDVEGAVTALADGEVRSVDVAEVNGRVFVNNSVLGVYPAMVAVREKTTEQRGWGKIRAVPVAFARVLRSFPTHRLHLSTPDGLMRRNVRTPFLFVGNGIYDNPGGGMAARPSLTDGKLGVSLARVVSRWGLMRTVVRALISGTTEARTLDNAEATEMLVKSGSSRLRVAVDGEVCWMNTPLNYKSRPGALRVLAPATPDAPS